MPEDDNRVMLEKTLRNMVVNELIAKTLIKNEAKELGINVTDKEVQERKDKGWTISGQRDIWGVRDQPTVEAYQHLDDYNFQIMVWEDDVWYMELLMYPPSTDDAYKIVALSICGPTSRWQMMRHWNVIKSQKFPHRRPRPIQRSGSSPRAADHVYRVPAH